jgi:hypothetical protein
MSEQRHETTAVIPSAIWSVEDSTCGGRIADHRTIGGGGGRPCSKRGSRREGNDRGVCEAKIENPNEAFLKDQF